MYIFAAEKIFQPFFSCITEYGRPQVTFYQRPQGIMAIDVQIIRSIL